MFAATLTNVWKLVCKTLKSAGSIGIQHGNDATEFWAWGIDTVIPMREAEAEGSGKDRKDCMRQFKAAWDRFSADPARLAEFVQAKRKRFG